MGIGGSTTEDKANEGESKKKTIKPSKRMEEEESKNVKSAVGGSEQRKDKKLPIKKRRTTLEERRVLALETMADSMEALVRTTLIPKTKLMMETKQFITKVFWSEVSVGACVAIAAFFAFHKSSN